MSRASVPREVVGRVLRVLRGMALRGRRCVRVVDVVSVSRLSLGEVEAALTVLVGEGVAVFAGDDVVCYTGVLEDYAGSDELFEELRSIASYRRFVRFLRDLRGVYPGVDAVVVRRDGVGLAVRLLSGRLPPERIVAEAKRLVKQSRRLLGEWRSVVGGSPPRVLLPVLVYRRGAPRLVEGVPVASVERLRDIVLDPSPLLADPRVRVLRGSD